MTGSHPPNVHANWSGVGTNRVTAGCIAIGAPPMLPRSIRQSYPVCVQVYLILDGTFVV
jgi:hypothetical protein